MQGQMYYNSILQNEVTFYCPFNMHYLLKQCALFQLLLKVTVDPSPLRKAQYSG